MPLPESRDFTAVDSGPLNATVVNAIQDAIVGGQHGEVNLMMPAGQAMSSQTAGVLDLAFTSLLRWTFSGTAAQVVHPLSLPYGARVDEWTGIVEDDAAVAVTIQLFEADLLATPPTYTTITGIKTSALTGDPEALTFTTADAGLPFVFTASRVYVLATNSLTVAGQSYYGGHCKFVMP